MCGKHNYTYKKSFNLLEMSLFGIDNDLCFVSLMYIFRDYE